MRSLTRVMSALVGAAVVGTRSVVWVRGRLGGAGEGGGVGDLAREVGAGVGCLGRVLPTHQRRACAGERGAISVLRWAWGVSGLGRAVEEGGALGVVGVRGAGREGRSCGGCGAGGGGGEVLGAGAAGREGERAGRSWMG